eukprot:5530862-Heterocapsa_arctica.AAC.1
MSHELGAKVADLVSAVVSGRGTRISRSSRIASLCSEALLLGGSRHGEAARGRIWSRTDMYKTSLHQKTCKWILLAMWLMSPS